MREVDGMVAVRTHTPYYKRTGSSQEWMNVRWAVDACALGVNGPSSHALLAMREVGGGRRALLHLGEDVNVSISYANQVEASANQGAARWVFGS